MESRELEKRRSETDEKEMIEICAFLLSQVNIN